MKISGKLSGESAGSGLELKYSDSLVVVEDSICRAILSASVLYLESGADVYMIYFPNVIHDMFTEHVATACTLSGQRRQR